jgi:hypothetical protein
MGYPMMSSASSNNNFTPKPAVTGQMTPLLKTAVFNETAVTR